MKRVNQTRGYTVVELLMALAVLAIGLGGVFAMQKVTVSANMHSKQLAMATHLAQSWVDELSAEAGQWNDTDDFNDTDWLTNAGSEGGIPGVWFQPTYVANRAFGAAFDALGNPVPTDEIAERAHFCTHVRLRWVGSQTVPKRGSGLIRAEVRVFWLRSGLTGLTDVPEHACDITPAALEEEEEEDQPTTFDDADARRAFHVVYLSTLLGQHMGTPE